MMKFWIITTILFIAVRVLIAFQFEPEPASFVGSYQAFAHILFGALAVSNWHQSNPIKATLIGSLLLVEVVCAFVVRLF